MGTYFILFIFNLTERKAEAKGKKKGLSFFVITHYPIQNTRILAIGIRELGNDQRERVAMAFNLAIIAIASEYLPARRMTTDYVNCYRYD